MSNDSLGDRQKRHENVSRHYLTRRVPVVIRLDGKAFSTLTRHLDKPFDQCFITSMVFGAKKVAEEMQGFKLAYIQSDEVSIILTDFETLETEAWFDYNVSKMVSVSASIMSTWFNYCLQNTYPRPSFLDMGYFDGRAFNVPREDVSNCILWRAKDWLRNSLQMYAHNFFSQKELHGKNHEDIHEMLYSIGKNWANDLTDQQKNGTYLIKDNNGSIIERSDILPNYVEISKVLDPMLSKDA